MTDQPVGGSFRDPSARVYVRGERVLRGVNAETLRNFQALSQTAFFTKAVTDGRIVATRVVGPQDGDAAPILAQGWAGVLEHDRVPLISYPYEWTFSMLKDAALLQLDLLESALAEGWIIKDSTPYNIQFIGSAPTFIDIPSFLPRQPGEYWRAYRQFCMLFLYPLMLTAHRGIAFQNVLRGSLDGVSPSEAARYFPGLTRFRKGVLAHVIFPAAIERKIETRQPGAVDASPAKARPQSDAMVRGLVQSVRGLVKSLNVGEARSVWSDYTSTHSYDPGSFDEKEAFVAEAAASSGRIGIAWDLGSNTGWFSELVARSADYVVSADSDFECVERLYQRLRARNDRQIMPVCLNVANPSPSQGWANIERLAFDRRNRPDFIIALALIHHICLSNNVPIPDFLEWLRGLGAKLVIEFVGRNDEMVREMLTRKSETFEDYNQENFERALHARFDVIAQKQLKGGDRTIYYCTPKA